MQLASSSMSPSLRGPHWDGTCSRCLRRLSLDSNRDSESTPTFDCPYCGKSNDALSFQNGDVVEILPIQSYEAVEIGDMCVFRVPSKGIAEVKRIVSKPHQKLEIRDGDLFIHGERFQKSSKQFMDCAISIGGWDSFTKSPIIESLEQKAQELYDGEGPKLTNYRFVYKSLWPRTSADPEPMPSPVLDEYFNNPDEDRIFVPVQDYGVLLRLQVLSRPISTNSFAIRLNTGIAEWIVRLQQTIPLQLNDQAEIGLLVAFVDGRLLSEVFPVQNSEYVFTQSVTVESESLPVETSESKSTLNDSLIELEISSTDYKVIDAQIVRDVHYRGPSGENEFAFPLVDGFHVLGDNISSSIDSRTDLSSGVPFEWIEGKVIYKRVPLVRQ